MTVREFWYCIRMELGRDQGRPVWLHFLRGLAKVLIAGRNALKAGNFPDTELVFVIITENHLKHFRPLAQELTRKNKPFVILFTGDFLYRKYAAEWPGKSFLMSSFVSRKQYFKAVLFQTRLLFRHFFSTSNEKACMVKFAVPAFNIHQTAIRILGKSKRKVALFKAEGYQANAVLLACKQIHLPTFAIQHGLIDENPYFSHLAVDNYLVWSEFFKKRLEASNAGCRITVTGNAAYDALFQECDQAGVQTVPATPLRILVLPNSGSSHTPLSQVHLLLSIILDFAKKHPEAVITVKPHPADNAENVAAYLTPYISSNSNIRLLDRFAPIPFEDQHLVVINNSGAGLEAGIRGIPMIVVAPAWEDVMVKQYIDNGVALFAATATQFSDAVSDILADYGSYQRKCHEFIREQLAFQGGAAEKIVEVLTC